MTNYEIDIDNLLKKIKSKQPYDKYYNYIKLRKNIIFSFDNNENIQNIKEKILKKQHDREIVVKNELELFDTFGIPFIGMKGPFIKTEFYNNMPRTYNDLDLLVDPNNAKVFYSKLKAVGYRIKKKTYYDAPNTNMYLFPKQYMNNTQTLMLINRNNNISIDLHCNLNITNMHFTKSTTKFSTSEFFKNSISYRNFSYIRQFDLYDNICVSIRHLLKHHVFYGKTQQGLETMVQHILDISTMLNSNNFNEKELFNRAVHYNIILESLFCLNLHNKIFSSCNDINIGRYLTYIRNDNTKYYWKPIILASLQMSPEDIMIGDYSAEFPKLQKAIEFSNLLPKKWMNWVFQRLFISFRIKDYLK